MNTGVKLDTHNEIRLDFGEFYFTGLEKIFARNNLTIKITSKKYEDQKLITCQKVMTSLLRTVEKRGLPKYYAFETMRRLLKMNKYLYSYRHQIIELISVLQDTNDQRLKNHINDLCKEVNYVKRI